MDMHDATNSVLVTAATWYIGGQAISAIKKKNPHATVVAGVYDKSKKAKERELWADADETEMFDANEPNTLDFSRFNLVCIIPSTNSARLVQFANMINECKRCATRPFVVFCSIADTFGYAGDFAKSTRHMEAILETSGLQYMTINCGFFHQNFEWNAIDMRNGAGIRLPLGSGKFAPVDARDVARFIGIVLKDPLHYEGHHYSMVGQQQMGGEGAARIAFQALNYPVEFEDIPLSVYLENLSDQGCAPGMAKALGELCAAIRSHDLEQTVTSTVFVTLGNRMTKLKDYFEDFAEVYESDRTTIEEQVQAEEAEREESTEVNQPGDWGDLTATTIDEGYAERKEGEGQLGEGRKPVQYVREEREEGQVKEAERARGEGWQVRKPTKGREEEEEMERTRQFGEREKPVQNGREEREEGKVKEAERGEGWRVRKVMRGGREEEEETGRAPPPVEEERVVAIERDIYYLTPKTEKRVDALRRAKRDYEDLLGLLENTINDWNEMLKDRRASLQADEEFLKRLEDRKDEILEILNHLDREIRDQDRSKDRPLVVYPTSLPPIASGMQLVSRRDEKLEGGTRRVERFESEAREPEYERYGRRGRVRYPEERRERRSASSTHLGREMERGRASTKLGREMEGYKGDNLLSRISHMLYGWKEKGEPEHRSSTGRDVERGDRYYRRETEYEEPRRESDRVDRDYEERRRRDLDRQDQERRQLDMDREERRRLDQEREREERRQRNLDQEREREERRRRDLDQERRRLEQDREERRRLDSDREYEERQRRAREKEERAFGPDDRDYELRREYEREKREYETERPKQFDESRPESRDLSKRVSFRGAQDEEERYEPKYRKESARTRKRESGYASESEEYVLIPKRVLQEAVLSS